MKLSALILLPATALAFAPQQPVSLFPTSRVSKVALRDVRDDFDDAVKKIEDTTEDYVGKADELVINRGMRLANHFPVLITLKALADKAGMSASINGGIVAAPEAFGGLSTALSVPTWCFNVWALAAVAQLASVAKSALSSDRDELSQADITSGAVSNWAAARMVGSANPLRDTIVAAVVSGFAMRNQNADGAVNIHTASTQLIASFTTTLAILGTISAAVARIAFLQDIPEATTLLGVAAMYVINARAGNGTVKKTVNSGIIAGILYNRLLQGVTFAFNGASIMSNLGLLAMATVATDSLNNLRKAVFN
mmetsp:Transcript_2776/g.8162  ORF Transcript_2776/g.8162 Transcript_2776/m.8162 type:complete len:310 (+) Transcript_2776:66-995(+)